MVGSVEYLVLGHFKREEGDEYGTRTMAWLTPVSRGTVKIDFSPFTPRTLPFGLEHAQG